MASASRGRALARCPLIPRSGLNTVSGPTARTYTYDAAGNIATNGASSTVGATTYTYNARGRLYKTVTRTSSTATAQVNYVYNGFGQRVRKTGNDGATTFVYDEAGQLIGEYDANNVVLKEHIWMEGIPVGTLTPNTTYYVHADHLGTPRVITNTAGVVQWRWDPDPFGNNLPNEDVDGNGTKITYNLRFPGQYYDKTAGSYYNYFRDYDPMTGRYLQSDPIGLAGGLNTYAYVGGNPLRFVDPYGLDATATLGRGLVFFGGAAAADGPSPIGDAIGAAGFLGFSAYAAYEALSDGPSEQATENTEACPGNGDKWKCEGYGQYEIIGQNKHVVRGPWFVAYGLTEPDAAYNWKKAVQAAAPPGHTARHIRPKRCTKIK